MMINKDTSKSLCDCVRFASHVQIAAIPEPFTKRNQKAAQQLRRIIEAHQYGSVR